MRLAFLRKSLIKHGNIFIQSSPEELSAFQQFLEQHRSRPFTVAFDGLNITGMTGGASTKLRSQLVGESFCALISFQFLQQILGPY